MNSIAKFFNHDFKNGRFTLYNKNSKLIYCEAVGGQWNKYEYNKDNYLIYYENSYGFRMKKIYDEDNNEIYQENSKQGILYINDELKDCDNCINYTDDLVCKKCDGMVCYKMKTFRSWEPKKEKDLTELVLRNPSHFNKTTYKHF